MREKLQRLIRAAYPDGVYTSRDASLLDRDVRESEIRAIAQALRQLESGDVTAKNDTNYDICYRIEIATPSHDHISALRRSSTSRTKRAKKALDPGYLTFLLISRLGRLFTLDWNIVSLRGDSVATDFSSSPPAPTIEQLAKRICGIVEGAGFERVSYEELREAVPWVVPGDSLVKDGHVTLYNCLFSEV